MSTILKIDNNEIYELEVSFNSLCLVEEIEGKSAELIFQEGNIGFKLMRTLFYAALNTKNPLITLEGAGVIAGNFCKANGFAKFVSTIMDEYQNSGCLGEADKNESDEDKKK